MWQIVPNMLSFVRLGLSVVFVMMVLISARVDNGPRSLDIAFAAFIVAGLTDVVDGVLARRYDATSKFGRIMDPLADKVFVCGAFISFAIIRAPRFFDWPATTLAVLHWSAAGALIVRETYVMILRYRAETRGVKVGATPPGKVKTAIQSAAIAVVQLKTAHLPTAAWMNWLTALIWASMVIVTAGSGLWILLVPGSWEATARQPVMGQPGSTAQMSAVGHEQKARRRDQQFIGDRIQKSP